MNCPDSREVGAAEGIWGVGIGGVVGMKIELSLSNFLVFFLQSSLTKPRHLSSEYFLGASLPGEGSESRHTSLESRCTNFNLSPLYESLSESLDLSHCVRITYPRLSIWVSPRSVIPTSADRGRGGDLWRRCPFLCRCPPPRGRCRAKCDSRRRSSAPHHFLLCAGSTADRRGF